MIDISSYGIEESIGFHVILSNILWWMSLVLVYLAYRYRHIWNVGDAPWAFLYLTFIFFGLRELGHFSSSPLIGSLRYISGTWSAVFMASSMLCLYMIICRRQKVTRKMTYIPFAVSLIFPVLWLFLYFSGDKDLKTHTGTLEGIIWILASSLIIYTTYMLGARVTGDFIKVFMLFQFSAYTALTWKFLGLIELAGYPMPYSIREILETLFGVFAILSMYVLTGMLRKLAKKLS